MPNRSNPAVPPTASERPGSRRAQIALACAEDASNTPSPKIEGDLQDGEILREELGQAPHVVDSRNGRAGMAKLEGFLAGYRDRNAA